MNGLRMIDASTYQVDTIASGIYSVGQGDFGAIAASPTADRVIATTNQNVGNYPFAILNSETGSVVNTSSLVARSIDVVFDPAGNAFAADFQFQLASPPGRIDKVDVSVQLDGNRRPGGSIPDSLRRFEPEHERFQRLFLARYRYFELDGPGQHHNANVAGGHGGVGFRRSALRFAIRE
jgi:hypothetical protein